MKIAYPAFSEPVVTDGDAIPCLVIENRRLFRSFLVDMASGIDGMKSDVVLSRGDKLLDLSKYTEVLTNFVNFDINKKTLINKIIGELEKMAVSPEYYLKTQELLTEIDNAVSDWAFSFDCDIIPSKISVPSLIKSVGIELRGDYEGICGEVEKLLDYMGLVREFERDKLFVTVNMRAYFDDEIIERFLLSARGHEFNILMLESQAYKRLSIEKRITIDEDLCEF